MRLPWQNRWIVINVVPSVGCASINLHFCSGRQMCSRGVWLVLVWGITAFGLCLAVDVGGVCCMTGDLCCFAFAASWDL